MQVLNRLKKFFSKSSKSKVSPRRNLGFRPQLEALEQRWCPKTTTWQGAADGLWSAGTNWDEGAPGSGDTVIFDGSKANTRSRISVNNATVARVITQGGYSAALRIDSALYLRVTGTAGLSTWAGGSICLDGTTAGVQLKGASAFSMNAGAFTGWETSEVGTVNVYDGGTLNFNSAFSATAARIEVGYNPETASDASTGTLNIGQTDLTGDITVYRDIVIEQNASCYLLQSANVGTAGGLLTSNGSVFTNKGYTEREASAGTTRISMEFINQGVLSILAAGGINFSHADGGGTYSFLQSVNDNAELNMGGGSTIICADTLRIDKGNVTFLTAGSGPSTCTVTADNVYFSSDTTGALINIGDSVTNSYWVTVAITGNLYINDGMDLLMRGIGTGAGNDKITVASGTATLTNSGSLEFHVQSSAPMNPTSWVLLDTPNEIAGDFSSKSLTGYTPMSGNIYFEEYDSDANASNDNYRCRIGN